MSRNDPSYSYGSLLMSQFSCSSPFHPPFSQQTLDRESVKADTHLPLIYETKHRTIIGVNIQCEEHAGGGG